MRKQDSKTRDHGGGGGKGREQVTPQQTKIRRASLHWRKEQIKCNWWEPANEKRPFKCSWSEPTKWEKALLTISSFKEQTLVTKLTNENWPCIFKLCTKADTSLINEERPYNQCRENWPMRTCLTKAATNEKTETQKQCRNTTGGGVRKRAPTIYPDTETIHCSPPFHHQLHRQPPSSQRVITEEDRTERKLISSVFMSQLGILLVSNSNLFSWGQSAGCCPTQPITNS